MFYVIVSAFSYQLIYPEDIMYQIKGKIDSNNAPEFEKEIMAVLPTEIDASGLEYISSAGLRVLLKLAT